MVKQVLYLNTFLYSKIQIQMRNLGKQYFMFGYSWMH